MDNEKQKSKRGRPPLSPEMKEQRRIERNKKINEYHKASGYAAQKKYRETNPEKVIEFQNMYYLPQICIRKEYKETLDVLLDKTNMNLTQLFLSLVEEKYEISLYPLDKKDN